MRRALLNRSLRLLTTLSPKHRTLRLGQRSVESLQESVETWRAISFVTFGTGCVNAYLLNTEENNERQAEVTYENYHVTSRRM